MSQDYNNPAFKKLLQKLQEESWQLELLISGFAIFGLFTAFPHIRIAATAAQNDDKIYSWIVLTVVMVSCAILIFNLLLHVVLRGLWIGALGLRYVSGDIDYEELNYSQKFTKYLKKKVGSFDRYIARLENYCSIIFAISFLLIFYVLAFTFSIISIVLIITSTLDNDSMNETLGLWIGIPLLLFFITGTILTFIDFLTLGWLKKKKWLSRIYFPMYWVFSKITLAFLYRPLVYNFLDNKFGRRVSLALVPIYILIVFASTYSYKTSNYFSNDMESNSVIANSRNYEDALTEDTFIEDVAIKSKVVTVNYLKVFMVMDDDFDDYIFDLNPSLKPEDDLRGLKSRIYTNSTVSWSKRDSLREAYIKTLNEVFIVEIDSINYNSEFIVGESTNGQKGFETYVGIKNLPIGKHLLKVLRKRIRKKDTNQVYYSRIPFWYYPN
ncbi:hypothetical protein H8K90_11735 [Winogradskyella echinorum]|uniref:RDD family protein n=1 Tax=Winogradskyella echinorum TaxID=538189 RepID=A0ABR6Y477_9FLAO|nr:hypothetical protein [Winogradskyella echinorum]MBC3847055.1 hypothetical protein [Winogradskyella echinorum]MBC5751403.1 hypothetical protein [Winogradskyella echinorum]